MTKKILSVLIVLCMTLTFVPFASATSVVSGYLMIDSMAAASGNGWSWEDGVLTLGNTDDFSSVLTSVKAKIVLSEDVTLNGSLLASAECEIDTGDYSLTLAGGINGDNFSIYNSKIEARSINATTSLNIVNSTVISDCSDMSYTFGIYAGSLNITNSVVFAASSMDENVELMAILASEMTVTDSIVKAYGNVYGIAINKASDNFSGALQINNSTIYADAGAAAVATSYAGQNEEFDFSALTIDNSSVVAPAKFTTVKGTYTSPYGSVMGFVAIANANYEVATHVVISAMDADKLPAEPEFPEMPEIPGSPSNPDEPDEPVIPDEPVEPEMTESVYYEFIGDMLYLTVITQGDYDRVALFYADSTDLSDCLVTASTYEDCGDGFRQWSLRVEAPTKATDYVIKCRDAATQSYKNGKEFAAFTINPPYVAPELDMLYVGGVNAFENPEGDGWYFDESTRTLTLDNCTLTQAGVFYDVDGYPIEAIIYARGDLIIEIIGDNYVEFLVDVAPTTNTTYGAIWIDPTHSDYEDDSLYIVGDGSLTAGVAITQEVYSTGLVEFSFGVYVFSEFGVDFSALEANSSVDFYGGVIGRPEVYNVRAFQIAPTYMDGTIIESYQDIECEIPTEGGYDPVNNESWRFKATISPVAVGEDGILDIMYTSPSAGKGWVWENNVLTINSEIDFIAVYIMLESGGDVKIVLTEDVTIDTRAKSEMDADLMLSSISVATLFGNVEIDTGDYTLTLINDRATAIESYNNLIINGNVIVETGYSGWDAISTLGDIIIDDSSFFSESGSIIAWETYDHETGDPTGGNVIITDSSVYAGTYDIEDVTTTGIQAYYSLKIDNSNVCAMGNYAGILASDIVINNSSVTAYGTEVGVEAYYSMSVDNSELIAESDYVAIAVSTFYPYYDEFVEGELNLKGVVFFTPEVATTGVATFYDVYGDEVQTTTVIDEDGNAAKSVWMIAGNYAEYDIINGKLIITVVTESRINRVALYGEDGKCIKTFNTYEVNEWGEYVWTIKMDAPTVPTTYVIKGRDAAANSYKAGFTLPAITVEPEVVFESVEVETRGDKVYVIATTVSDNYDRVAVVNLVDNSYVKYTRNYQIVDGKYVWTIFFDYVEGMENLVVKARDIRTKHYNNAQAVNVTVDAPVEPVIDVTITDYDEENVLVTITTIPDLYRVKIAYADDPTSHIAYARNPVSKTDDAWTWEMLIDIPSGTTEYAVDIAYVKAYARYFTYVTYTAQ